MNKKEKAIRLLNPLITFGCKNSKNMLKPQINTTKGITSIFY